MTKCDKTGNETLGSRSPDRCVVCLAWVRHPYTSGSVAYCADCYDLDETKQEYIRQAVRDRLEDLWNDPEQVFLDG